MTDFVGLDLSLTGTGIAWFAADQNRTVVRGGCTTFRSVKDAGTIASRHSRLDGLRREVLRFVARDSLVAIEAPAYHSAQGKTHDRSGLWWLIVTDLLGKGCRVVEVSPTTRAKFAAGHGRASKRLVMERVAAVYGVRVRNDNEADAVALAAIAARLGGVVLPVERHVFESWSLAEVNAREDALRGVLEKNVLNMEPK